MAWTGKVPNLAEQTAGRRKIEKESWSSVHDARIDGRSCPVHQFANEMRRTSRHH